MDAANKHRTIKKWIKTTFVSYPLSTLFCYSKLGVFKAMLNGSLFYLRSIKGSTAQQAAGRPDPACRLNLLQGCLQRDEQMRHYKTPRRTCTDSDGTNKLLSPAAAPYDQSQVCLLNQLVHCALQKKMQGKQKKGALTCKTYTVQS